VSTIVVVGVVTPCSLPSVHQLLEEKCCISLKIFIDLRATRSYNLRFKYMKSRIYLYGLKINTNTKITFLYLFWKLYRKHKGMFPSQNLYIPWDHYEQTVIVFIECNWKFINYPNDIDLFLLLPYYSRTPLFLTNFSRHFLHCVAVWTLKLAERYTFYTKAAS